MLLVAVKKAVAERYMQNGNWRLEEHPQYQYVQACTAAAHNSLSLAQRTVQVCSSRILLHSDLHFVFNAAVILLLNQILRAHPGASDTDISFAIELFAREAQIGSDYQRDCYQVLKDLKTLVDRFLAPEAHRRFSHGHGTDHSQPDTPSTFDNELPHVHDAGQGHYYPTEGNTVYQELLAWRNDENMLHCTFRI